MKETLRWRQFDYLLLLVTFCLAALGFVMIQSTTEALVGNTGDFWTSITGRQIIYASIGLTLMVVLAALDYRWLGQIASILYGVMLLLLVATVTLGIVKHGANRWLTLGPIELQPSELAKIICIVVVAKFLADREEKLKSWRTYLYSLGLMVVPVGLVFLQPDLGTSTVIVFSWLGMMLVAGVRLRYLALTTLLFLALIVPAWLYVVPEYQKERFLVFADRSYCQNPDNRWGPCFNLDQAEVAIGSAGIFGKGLRNGTQVQGQFLRVSNADFIFSALTEELGYVGAMGLFLLLTVLLMRGIRGIGRSRDLFGRLLAAGVVSMLLYQSFVNIAGNLRLLPMTGVPLPLVSAGGSALISVMIGLGLIQSVVVRHRRPEPGVVAAPAPTVLQPR